MARCALPPLDVIGPDGTRLTLRSLHTDTTVGELASSLGTESLAINRALRFDERLVDIPELRRGARLRREPETAIPDAFSAVLEIAITAGPAASSWRPLLPGRHLIGRSPHAALTIEDPDVEAHHAVLFVGEGGVLRLVQLTGAVPIRIDGRVVDAECQPVAGSRISIGSSVIELRRRSAAQTVPTARGGLGVGSVAPHPNDPWHRIVWRGPDVVPAWNAPRIVPPVRPTPRSRPPLTGLVGAAVTALGATTIAVILDNATFVVFALVGVAATIATSLVGLAVSSRARRRAGAKYSLDVTAFGRQIEQLHRNRIRQHVEAHRTVFEAMSELRDGGTKLWRRRLGTNARPDGSRDRGGDGASAGDDLQAVVGTGTHRWSPHVDVDDGASLDVESLHAIERCSRLEAVPAVITLRRGEAIAITGPMDSARSVVRSVIAQIATWVGPADWQLVVVTCDQRAWHWTNWLPHGAHGGRSVIAANSIESLREQLDAIDHRRRTVLVTDEPTLLTARTGPVRRFVSASDATAIVIVDRSATVPAACRRAMTIGSTGTARWLGDVPESDDSERIEIVGVSTETADAMARMLAHLIDPEDDGGSAGGLPSSVRFVELFDRSALTAPAIAARWSAAGPDPAPIAPLGVSADGRVDIDLVRDGPHGLIAGTTGAGKSELLRTLVLSLAASVSPRHLNFVLVDYKGGSTFDACTSLPHTVGLVTDLDDGLAERALISLDAEIHRREQLLRSVAACDLADYQSRRATDGRPLEPIPRLVVVIDEFAALAKDLPTFLSALVDVAQRGRSLGVHLLLATQRPAGVVSNDIRANTNLRLSLRLNDRTDAVDVVDDDRPTTFPRTVPGRVAVRLGPDELFVFQAAHCTGAFDEDDGGLVVERHDDLAVSQAGGGTAERQGRRWSEPVEAQPSELETIVQRIVEAADGFVVPHRPWVEPLSHPLTADDLRTWSIRSDEPVIGLIDDPRAQSWRPLSWSPTDGSLAVVGSVGSGTTSTLLALAAAACSTATPDRLHLAVIDSRGDEGLAALATIAHCLGVVRLTEDERLHRLLHRVVSFIDARSSADVPPETLAQHFVVMIDGFTSLRNALGTTERIETSDLLHRVLTDGPAAGVILVVADDAGSAIANVSVTQRWVFHVDDACAAGLGMRAAPIPAGRPGRFRIAASGLEGQIVQGAPGLAELPAHDDVECGPYPIVSLPERVTVADLDRVAAPAAVGLCARDVQPTTLDVPPGDHVLVVGGPRTGVSTAVRRCVDAWQRAAEVSAQRPLVVRLDRLSVNPACVLEEALGATKATRVAVVVDDAHRVDDDGTLVRIAQGEFGHITLFVGARADNVRSAYGHWIREVAKSRCGVVMASRGEPDGDLLGVQLPRRPLIAARPGLGWIVDTGPLRQVQIACAD